MQRRPGHGDSHSRRSPVLAGAALLAVVVIAGELVLLVRAPRQHQARQVSPGEVSGRALPTESGATPPSRPRSEPPRAVAEAGGHAAETSAARDAGPGASAAPALRRRDLLVAAHTQQAIQEADERVFLEQGFPEERRVAVRLLNEREARHRQDVLAAARDDLSPEEQAGASIAIGDQIARARQEALRSLLGVDASQAFLVAEAAEIRRIQRRYRVQWAQELNEQAPMPPGLPPRAH